MKKSILEDMADQVEDITAPDDKALLTMQGLCNQYVAAEHEVAELEAALEEAKEKLKQLKHHTVPDKMLELGLDNFGLPDQNVDVVLKPYYRASISSNWEEDKRNAAFNYLTELGGEDLIKYTVTYAFDKQQSQLAKALMAMVQAFFDSWTGQGYDYDDLPEPELPSNT